jgi:hypothetical protein
MWEDMRKQADAAISTTYKIDILLMIKRAQFIWESCFTTGANKGPTGVNSPVVI